MIIVFITWTCRASEGLPEPDPRETAGSESHTTPKVHFHNCSKGKLEQFGRLHISKAANELLMREAENFVNYDSFVHDL